jgi:hypothetical protein
VITIAGILGTTVVAEGIERHDQVAALEQLGCTIGQGYLLYPPLDPTAALALAREQGNALLPRTLTSHAERPPSQQLAADKRELHRGIKPSPCQWQVPHERPTRCHPPSWSTKRQRVTPTSLGMPRRRASVRPSRWRPLMADTGASPLPETGAAGSASTPQETDREHRLAADHGAAQSARLMLPGRRGWSRHR